MYAQVEKSKEGKSRAVANAVTQKKSSVKQGFGFVDNRKKTCAPGVKSTIIQGQVKTNAISSLHGQQLIQRSVRVGPISDKTGDKVTYWYTDANEISEAAIKHGGASALALNNLGSMAADSKVFEFSDWNDAFDKTEVDGPGIGVDDDQEIKFSGSSGEKVDGFYHDTAQGIDKWKLQSRDAEVAILQKLENWIEEHQVEVEKFTRKTIYIKISKGPCDSCRSLINKFRVRHPSFKVIMQYSQTGAKESDRNGAKDKGQATLAYGYGDATTTGSNSWLKVHPTKPIDSPSGISGYKLTTLKGLYDNFKLKYSNDTDKVSGFVDQLPHAVWKDSDKEKIKEYLWQYILYEKQQALNPEETEELDSIQNTKVQGSVTATAMLTLHT